MVRAGDIEKKHPVTDDVSTFFSKLEFRKSGLLKPKESGKPHFRNSNCEKKVKSSSVTGCFFSISPALTMQLKARFLQLDEEVHLF